MSLFAELQRRNVIRVAVAYAVASWLLIEAATVALEGFGAPGWVPKAVATLLALGFPVALFFAWAFEITPEGIKRESDVDRGASVSHATAKKLDIMVIVLLVAAIGLFGADRMLGTDEGENRGQTPISSEATAGKTDAGNRSLTPISEPSVAVLPFTNMSTSEENAYFADGLTDTLLHMLAQVPDLKVAARTSSFAFKGKDEDIRSIAQQLGVENVLEGSVQRAGDRVRITAQLIQASDGFHLWSQVYDRDLDDIFAVQDEIATEVATALKGSLLGESITAVLDDGMTRDQEAYDLYLRALEAYRTGVEDQLVDAERWLRRALVVDPEFALGWSLLSETLNMLARTQGASWVDVRDEILATAERGAELAPGVAQTQATLGRVYEDNSRELEAVEVLESALERHPGNAALLTVLADVKFDQGAFDEAVALSEQAMAADPLDLNLKANATYRLNTVGRKQDALALGEAVLAREPDHAGALSGIANIHWRTGDESEALRYYHRLLQINPNMRNITQRLGWSYQNMGRFEHAERLLRDAYEQNPQAMADDMARLYWDMGDRERAHAYIEERLGYELTESQRAWAERELAQMDQDWARLLELAQLGLEVSAETGGELNDGNLIQRVALAADRLGDTETRDAAIQRYLGWHRAHKAAGDRTFYEQAALARLYGLLGNVDKAVEHLEIAHERGFRDVVGLEAEGYLDSIWDDPRVQAVIEKIEQDNAREFAEMRAVAEELGSEL